MSELPCQVCGRRLVPLKDGTSRYHTPRRRGTGGMEGTRCSGSGFRLPRWPEGQRLQHHAGSVWIVVEDRAGHGPGGGDYLIRCVVGSERPGFIGGEKTGATMTAHGEYMHRHGWTPVPPRCEWCGADDDLVECLIGDKPQQTIWTCANAHDCQKRWPDEWPPGTPGTPQEPEPADAARPAGRRAP